MFMKENAQQLCFSFVVLMDPLNFGIQLFFKEQQYSNSVLKKF